MRWCDLNPKVETHRKNLRDSIPSEVRIKKLKNAHAIGKFDNLDYSWNKPGRAHTTESKEKLRNKALASPHRRLKKSTREYIQKDGTTVILDSSWEEALAIRLDELNIKWIRPDPIKWIDDNELIHNYFPDFYLPAYNLFLDPKNQHARKVQKDKLQYLSTQLKNLVIIESLNDCKNFNPVDLI